MSVKSQARREGWLEIDHRASPGIPEAIAERLGYKPKQVGEGKRVEFKTIACGHCPNCFVLNPNRVRERYYCRRCDHYVCDNCKAESLMPGYVHETRYEKMNRAMGLPIFIP